MSPAHNAAKGAVPLGRFTLCPERVLRLVHVSLPVTPHGRQDPALGALRGSVVAIIPSENPLSYETNRRTSESSRKATGYDCANRYSH